MKKTLSTLLLCVAGISSNVHAAWQDNFLVGGSAGYVSSNGPFVLTDHALVGTQGVHQRDLHDDAFFGGLLAGYQSKCNRWLLGVELNVDYRNLDKSHDFASSFGIAGIGFPAGSFLGDIQYEREWVVGLSGRVGYAIASYLMPYLRAGVETSDDQLSVNFTVFNGGVPSAAISLSESDWTYRLFGGIGVEVPLAMWVDGLALRAEYDYHHRGQGVTARAVLSNGTVVTAEMKQHNQTGIVSLVWNFG